MAVKKSDRHVFKTKSQVDALPDIEFELYDTVFKARPRIQALKLVEFIETNSGEEDSNLVHSFREMLFPFFKSTLYKESYDSLMEMCASDDSVLVPEDLVEIFQWLLEQYTDRPTSGSQE